MEENPANPTIPNQPISQPKEQVPPVTPAQNVLPPEPPPEIPTPTPIYETPPQNNKTPSGESGDESIFQKINPKLFAGVLFVVLLILFGVVFLLTKQKQKVKETSSIPPTPEAHCQLIKAYDENWSRLSFYQLSQLKTGDKVRFTVFGETNNDSFDKARFKINQSEYEETVQKKPQTEEFYVEYTVPLGVTSFTVEGQIHHPSLGWL